MKIVATLTVQSRSPGQAGKSARITTEPQVDRLTCEFASMGILDRISVSPSETKICFEYQTGFKYACPGRTLYVAGFDVTKRTITNLKPFANAEGKKVWFAYPRFTKGETSIVYHAAGKLFLYSLADGSTKQVSTDAKADYRYPHSEATPN